MRVGGQRSECTQHALEAVSVWRNMEVANRMHINAMLFEQCNFCLLFEKIMLIQWLQWNEYIQTFEQFYAS